MMRGNNPEYLEKLRQTTRVALADRPIIATGLGNLACKMAPDNSMQVVRGWFETCWEGNRWDKRLRYVRLPGDKDRDPTRNDSYIASGRDWARLIEVATASAFQANARDEAQYRRESDKITRSILDGTTFRTSMPLDFRADLSARGILADFARKVQEQIEEETGLPKVWGSRLKFAENGAHLFYASDANIELGYLVYRRTVPAFIVPAEAVDENPAKTSASPAQRCVDWLVRKKLLRGEGSLRLPAVKYDEALGYGWREIEADDFSSIFLDVDEKPNGRPGLKIWTGRLPEARMYIPRCPGEAILQAIAVREKNSDIDLSIEHLEDVDDRILYEFVDWSHWATADIPHLEDADVPKYFIVDDFRELPEEPGGWLDDEDDIEVSRLLFTNEATSWFYPLIPVDDEAQPPSAKGTVAAAIFANWEMPLEDQIGHRLIAIADKAAKPHLKRDHEARLRYGRLLGQMFSDKEKPTLNPRSDA